MRVRSNKVDKRRAQGQLSNTLSVISFDVRKDGAGLKLYIGSVLHSILRVGWETIDGRKGRSQLREVIEVIGFGA